MNYLITLDPVGIFSTGAAVDNAAVFGSLRMARAALDGSVAAEIVDTNVALSAGIAALENAARERIRDLRAQRKIALKVREGDLPSDATIPAPSPPPAAPAAAVPDLSPVACACGIFVGCKYPLCPVGEAERASGEPTAGTGDGLEIPAFLRKARA